MTNLFGLPVNVYRTPLGDCTANGLSSRQTNLLLVGESIDRVPFEVKENEDYLVVEHRPRFNDYIATPKSVLDAGVHAMFGGNFAYTSDSRFPADAPIKIMDRVENKSDKYLEIIKSKTNFGK